MGGREEGRSSRVVPEAIFSPGYTEMMIHCREEAERSSIDHQQFSSWRQDAKETDVPSQMLKRDLHPSRPPLYSRLLASIRLSLNMLRSIYHVAAIGVHNGGRDIWLDILMVLAMAVARDVFACVFSKVISDLYAVCMDVIRKDYQRIQAFLGRFVAATVSYAIINGTDVYFRSRLAIKMRVSLNDWHNSLYFDRYRIVSTQSPPPIDNVDQRLTEDIEQLSRSTVDIFAVLLVQPFSILYFLYYAYSMVAWSPFAMLGHFVASVFVMRATMNPVLRLAVRKERAEADFRQVHFMAKKQAEPICISDGTAVHKLEADMKFDRIVDLQRRLARLSSWNDGVKAFFDYTNSFWAYLIIIAAARTRTYTHAGTTEKEITMMASEMAYLLLQLFYKFGQVAGLSRTVPTESAHAVRLIELLRRLEIAQNDLEEVVIAEDNKDEEVGLVTINFDNVDLYTPSDRLIVYGLSLHISPGQHTLILGPSGAGKSSLIRCLAGLWPCRGGQVKVSPAGSDDGRLPVLYTPQSPVIVSGTIVDQLYYPKVVAPDPASLDEHEAALLQERIKQCLAAVSLLDLFQARLGGSLDRALPASDWLGLLSPGEVQRLCLARCLLHLPVFAILDEATNAIETPLEREIYEVIWAAGVTTVSVSHRAGFVKEHASIVVQLDGKGNHQVHHRAVMHA